MSSLKPQIPYIFPEPRTLEEISAYEYQPPFSELALEAKAVFGVTSALTARGVDTLSSWMPQNPNLQARLILAVYPACATREADLSRLLDLVSRTSGRVAVRIWPLERVTDRGANALCFLDQHSDDATIVAGPSEDLGLVSRQDGHANFVFRADPALVESFRRYFDWMWGNSRDITVAGLTNIPDLIIPEGTEEASQLWRAYVDSFGRAGLCGDPATGITSIDSETGDIKIRSEDGQEIRPPTEEIGLPKLDQLAERIARLYAKGALVSIDKLSRIPPLDSPLDPRAFGDTTELHRGNVVRKVSMRVSVIDEKTLKEIEKRRQGMRNLLTKFTFGLADNMRWMPNTARELFESELKRINEEGQKLIADLLKGDVAAFIDGKRDALTADINAMYAALGRSGQVTKGDIERIVDNLKDRLNKAQSANFMPMLSYSVISFARTETTSASPWGQAFSCLADVAAFPRKALTDSFFFRGLNVSDDDLIEAMNVADDALCRNLRTRGIKDRCNVELELLDRIKRAPIESRKRCEMVARLLDGDSIKAIDEAMQKAESE